MTERPKPRWELTEEEMRALGDLAGRGIGARDLARALVRRPRLLPATLRSVLGQAELDDLLASRDRLNQDLQKILDSQTESWGIKVSSVEVKHVDLPQDMQRAMARQAEAERERRAKVINADGEFQAAAKLSEAAEVLARFPIAIQLRFLQTMREIASERNTTTFFPIPLDILGPLLGRSRPDDK